MTCPHLQDGRCGLAELLALRVLSKPLTCAVSQEHCESCLTAGVASEDVPTLRVTAAVSKAIEPADRRTWAAYASKAHRGKRHVQEVTHVKAPAKPAYQVTRKDPGTGPGTILSRILKERYDAKEEADCPCKSRLSTMNAKGADWCEANIETIVDWLMEEVDRRKLWQRKLPERVKRWGLRKIVREAIDVSRIKSAVADS